MSWHIQIYGPELFSNVAISNSKYSNYENTIHTLREVHRLAIETPDFVQVVINWQGSPVSPVWRPDQPVGRLGPLKATPGAQDNRLLELVSLSSANLLITALNGS